MTNAHDVTHANPTRVGAAVMCEPFETGYELNPIQRQAAIATASRWRDAIITAVSTDGWIEIRDLDTDAATQVWHYADLSAFVAPGEPVTINAHYGVLALGRNYLSVRVA
jgi:hypothetical protein